MRIIWPAVRGAEKGDSHHVPVAEGDTAPAESRGLETHGGYRLFSATALNQVGSV
jgi:hypothetical protein